MKKLTFLGSFLGAFFLITAIALAHGGSYAGPGGVGTGSGFVPAGTGTTTPTGGPTGTGTTGGTSSGGTAAGTGGGGGTPGAGPVRPNGGGAAAGGAAAGARGGSSSGRRKKASGSSSGIGWQVWWFFNDDQFLNLKSKIRKQDVETENADLFLGDDAGGGDDITRVPAKKIREKILPILKLGVKDSFFDTRAAAVIALGKAGTSENFADISAGLKDEDKRVRESSCLGMGILGSKEAIPLLIDVMTNSPKGKDALGRRGKDIQDRTRAFAALAIGLIGSRDDITDTQGVSALLDMLTQKHPSQDLSVGPLVALGIMEAKEATPALIKYLQNDEKGSRERSYAATTLGKIGDRSAIPALLKGLRNKHNPVKRSCAIALGQLCNAEDKEAFKQLRKAVKSAADRGTRNFAIMSIGQIGGIDQRNYLSRLLREKNRFDKTWAAMALGVYAFNNEDPEVLVIAENLMKSFKSCKNFEERGAYAIALGLMKYDLAGDLLLSTLHEGGQASFRGHLCTAMGLMEHKAAIKVVREVVGERGDVNLRRAASIALGLLGDKDAVKVLQKEIARSSNSQAVHGAVTQGLGFIGDVSAVDSLNDMVREKAKYKDATRAFAAVALGLLGDKDALPILAKISENNNYLEATDAIKEVLTIL